MPPKPVSVTIATTLTALTIASGAQAVCAHGACAESDACKVTAVEFVGMPAPATAEDKASMYTGAQAIVTYQNCPTQTYDLAYHTLMSTTEQINGKVVGGLWDVYGDPITDADGQLASDAPDGNSLMKIPAMKASDRASSRALALVTQYEYKELPPTGESGSFWSKLPATMSLAKIDQDKGTGALAVADYSNIDFASINGLWIPCAASLTPWNTHLGSEEYEPDAKVREGGTPAAGSDDTTDIDSFSQNYFGDATVANAYDYGVVPEVTVHRDGSTAIDKHYALGRIARELAEVMPDKRTVYMGDDGKNTGLFMFVADRAGDLSRGTLYAAKWHQTSPVGSQNGTADLSWVRLGHASDAAIQALVDGGITFSQIFAWSNSDPDDPSYTMVDTYMGSEWLRVKPGMEQAAAFLETRRYAALLGATTEFSKMEGVSHDPQPGPGYNGKGFVVISRQEKGMADTAGDIQVARNDGGAVYEMELVGGQQDTAGAPIASAYVAANMSSIPELLGGWNGGAKDAEGNQCEQDKVCGADNLKFAPAIRTLFLGEDTSRRNNNYVWAFNVDTRKLSRILSTPMNAEATGLQVVQDAYGFAYIMSNFQHPGEGGTLANYLGADRQEVLDLINSKWDNRKKTAIGYLGTADGALPALQ